MPNQKEVYLDLGENVHVNHLNAYEMFVHTLRNTLSWTKIAQNPMTYLFLFSQAVLSIWMYNTSGKLLPSLVYLFSMWMIKDIVILLSCGHWSEIYEAEC